MTDHLKHLMEEGALTPELLDRMLGAYAIFECRNGRCLWKQASGSFLKMVFRDEAAWKNRRECNLMDAIHPEDREKVFEAVHNKEGHGHCRVRRNPDIGPLCWLEFDILPLEQKPEGALYCAILREMSAENRTAEALEDSQSALRTVMHISKEDMTGNYDLLAKNQAEVVSLLADILPIGILGAYFEQGFPMYFASGEMVQMLGYDSYEAFYSAVQGQAVRMIYREDFERLFRELPHEGRDGQRFTATYRIIRRDGSLFWVLDESRVVQTEDDRLAIISFCMDITGIMGQVEHLQQEMELLEQQSQDLQFLHNSIPVGYHRCADTPDYDFTFVSNRFAQMLGYTRQEIHSLFQDKFRNMVHPEDWERLFEGEQNAKRLRDTDLCFEYRIKARDGYRWVVDQCDYVTSWGKPFFQGAILDVTDRVELREKLKTSIKAFRIAASEAGSLVFTYHRDQQMIHCDEEIAETFGVETEQYDVPYGILRRGDIVSEDTADIYRQVHEAILRGEREAGGIVRMTTALGQQAVYDLKIQTIYDDNDQPTDLAVGVYKDITDQYQQLQRLEKSQMDLRSSGEKLRAEREEQLDMIFALSRDYYALWRLDLDNDLLFLRRTENLRTLSMKDQGQTKPNPYSESLARFAERRVHPDDRETLMREASLSSIREHLANADAFSVRVRRMPEGGKEYTYVEWRIVRMASEKGRHLALIAVKDIEGDVLMEARRQSLLQDALTAAEHASRAKTTFLSNMSHDIRTPMNAIIGFASIAASHIDNKERVQDCLEKILSSSNHLLSLINDILDMSRIESGKVSIQEKECNLSERIHALVNMIRPQMLAKGLEFYVDTIDIQDEELIFDPLRLDQVLINILSNAVKFTPMGGMVSFTIRQSESVKAGCSHFEFVIKDTGIGMSESFQKRLFSPFERENSSTASGIQGTGLGMSIAKNTVEMMGGTIEVQSVPNKGSTFRVSFDFKRQNVERRKAQIQELQGLRTLVVDDDFNICDSVTKMLEQIGMRSEWTTSGRDAVFRAQKAHSDGDPYYSYIIDWLMPQMDGIETVRRIRRIVGDEAPIIILTAYDWTEIEEEARAAGVTAFCNKPLFMSDLQKVLVSASQPKAPEPEAEPKPRYNFNNRRVLVVEDNELNREIVTEVLMDGGFVVEAASDGSIAVDMMREAEEGRYDLILMDIQMPVMDGYEAARAIRFLPRQDVIKLPIIAMTANAFEEDKERAIQNGMNAHIAKPLNVDVLMETLGRILAGR